MFFSGGGCGCGVCEVGWVLQGREGVQVQQTDRSGETTAQHRRTAAKHTDHIHHRQTVSTLNDHW